MFCEAPFCDIPFTSVIEIFVNGEIFYFDAEIKQLVSFSFDVQQSDLFTLDIQKQESSLFDIQQSGLFTLDIQQQESSIVVR